MRKYLALVSIAILCLPMTAGAKSKPPAQKPLVVVFGATMGAQGAPVSLEITAAVMDQLNRSGKVEIITFAPDLPNIARAVLEKRVTKDALDAYWEPKNAAQLAQILKAQYALCLQGTTTDEKTTVSLELVKAPSGGDWKTSAESVIAPGARSGIARANAISTASSSAVSQILLEAFGGNEPLLPDKPPVVTPAQPDEQPAPVNTTPTPAPTSAEKPRPATGDKPVPQTATEPPKPAEPARDVVAEYNEAMKQVEVYLTKKDMRNAALELRHAINLDPLTVTARVKLAGVYSDLGMNAEAIDECKRALQFSKDNANVLDILLKLYLADGKFAEAADQCRQIIQMQPNNIQARIALGDISWNQAKIDDAAAAYTDALKVDPKNADAHGRLQKLFAARKMYGDALQHLIALKVPSADTEPNASKRYTALAGVIQDEFAAVLDKLDTARRDYDQGKTAREDYYKECKDAASRIDALATYLSTQTAPAGFKEANPHGVLATSLLSQASGYMLTYLETEKASYKEQAALLVNEAKTEMSLFLKAVNKNG